MTAQNNEIVEQGDALSPPTLPPNIQLSLRGLNDNAEWNENFKASLVQILIDYSRVVDLRLLDGITVGFDYADALNSLDLGWESSIAKRVTNSEEIVGVGKLLRVKRNGQIMGHVVINGNFIAAIADPHHLHFASAANTIVHELAHVAVLGWFEKHSPGILLQPYRSGWLTGQLQDAAHTIWEEYAASRLCLGIGGDSVESNFIEIVETASTRGLSEARNYIKKYRNHRDVTQIFVELTQNIANPLTYAAYLLGHLDGSESEREFNHLCPVWSNSEYGQFLPLLHEALKAAWDSRLEWNGMSGVDGIVEVILNVFEQLGVYVSLSDHESLGELYIPYRKDTMPD